jgi:L-rhamnose mutarotase
MKPYQRFCLTLELQDDPDLIEEYKFWHAPENIWPEIPEGIKSAGIEKMEIYLLGTRLFMIIEAGSDFNFAGDMEKLSLLPRQKEWEQFVARFQKVVPNANSREKWMMMDRIY